MPAITATLVGVSNPRAVQVVVTGLTIGNAYQITGTGAGTTWPVRAGAGTATATQVIVTDVQTPVNTTITYTVLATSGTATSSSVVVDYDDKYVLQTLDGKQSASFTWLDNGDPRDILTRVARFAVPGRTHALTRWDAPSGEDGQLLVATQGAETGALKALFMAGAPLLLRTDGDVRDLAAVEFVHILSIQNALSGVGIQDTNQRRWTLGFTVIDDPEPDTLVASSTWADFETSYVGITWATFQTEWTGQTWLDFQVHDWATRAAS